MPVSEVVLDTHILISALRSRRGASAKLLSLVGAGHFMVHLSAPLVLEYEAVLMHLRLERGLTQDDVTDLVDSLCALSTLHEIDYLWRPYLRDPADEFVLDLAVAARCDYIITHNWRNFAGAERFGIGVVSPGRFLRLIGEAE